jgi:hypothetical protein
MSLACANDGIISNKSPYAVEITAERFQNALKEKGMTIFLRINHSEGAKSRDRFACDGVDYFWESKRGVASNKL